MAEIIISNKMASRYNLVGHRESRLGFEVVVGNYQYKPMTFEIQAKVIRKRQMPFELEVVHASDSYMGFEITPKINKTLGFEIEVSPRNQMTAKYELLELPTKEWEGYPVQDSYILSESPYSSINYGGNNSLVVGKNARGDATAFVQFDLSSLEENIRIKNAKFRLYFNDLTGSKFDLYQVTREWREYDITFLNAPDNPVFLTNQYTVNYTDRYIEFDVTDIVSQWNHGIPNNGFCITSPNGVSTSFRSRETSDSPELLIEYFSTDPINLGRSKQSFEITPKLTKNSTQSFELEVISFYKQAVMTFEIFAHDPNHIFHSTIGFDLYASRPDLAFEITSARGVKEMMAFEIAVMEDTIDMMSFEIEVPSFSGDSSIAFEITPSLVRNRMMEFEIIAQKEYKEKTSLAEFEIFAQGIYKDKKSNQAFEITSALNHKEKSSDMGFEISPQLESNPTMEFIVDALTDYKGTTSECQFEISASKPRNSIMSFDIYASRKGIEFEITVPHVRTNSIEFEISAKKLTISRQEFEIEVGIPIVVEGSYIYIV